MGTSRNDLDQPLVHYVGRMGGLHALPDPMHARGTATVAEVTCSTCREVLSTMCSCLSTGR